MPPKRKRKEAELDTKGQKIILHNDTGKPDVRFNLCFEYPNNGGCSYTSRRFDEESNSCDVTDQAGWKLRLGETGYAIKCDGVEVQQVKKPRKEGEYVPHDERYPSVVLELGKEYRIVTDDNFPPFTEEDQNKAFALAVSCVEHGGRIPPLSEGFPSLLYLAMKKVIKHHEDLSALAIPEELKNKLEEFKDQKQPIWAWIAQKLGRPARFEADVMHAATEGRNPQWKKLYYPRRPQLLPIPPHLQQSLLLSAIEKGEVGVVVYFRATDRFPGGNADVAIMKYKFFLPQQPQQSQQQDATQEGSECVVTWSVYRNWDGSPSGHKRSEERQRVSCEKVREGVLSPIVKVIKGMGVEVETHVIDPQSDGDAYETEWSSIEVLVYLPPKNLPSEILDGVSSQIGRESFPPPPTAKKKSKEEEEGTKNEEKKRGRKGNTRRRKRKGDDDEEDEKEDIWVPPNGGPEDQWLLAFRFHQAALLTETWADNEDKRVDRHLTADAQEAKRLVDGVSELLGMGPVESTLDGFDSDPKAVDTLSYEGLEDACYAFPVFLYEN